MSTLEVDKLLSIRTLGIEADTSVSSDTVVTATVENSGTHESELDNTDE